MNTPANAADPPQAIDPIVALAAVLATLPAAYLAMALATVLCAIPGALLGAQAIAALIGNAELTAALKSVAASVAAQAASSAPGGGCARAMQDGGSRQVLRRMGWENPSKASSSVSRLKVPGKDPNPGKPHAWQCCDPPTWA